MTIKLIENKSFEGQISFFFCDFELRKQKPIKDQNILNIKFKRMIYEDR